jgi:hypothetical protein
MGGRHRRPDNLDRPDWEQDAAVHTERPQAVVICSCHCNPCGGGEHCHHGDTGCTVR